ncbi:hypothetical protein ACHHYP_05397 [Achlya hypogyna]|uniref:Uncharacterized protein n=1 Tax=Achlya hypogyna TaxID=1202772 RepID=A0A1V9YXP3_ACHHY|nr:hypothetical protein ACHHYP_05397 [Achlya hypogyna]
MSNLRATLASCVYFAALAAVGSLVLYIVMYESVYRYKLLDYTGLQLGVRRLHGLEATTPRGLLMCITDASVPLGASMMQEIRSLGNRDRIFVYHCMGELSTASQDLLRFLDHNIVVYDACADAVALGILSVRETHSYQSSFLKLLALLHAPVDHAIVLDAGNVLLADPALVRSTPGYADTGSLFFYDREVLESDYLLGRGHSHLRGRSTNLHELIASFDYNMFGIKPAKSQRLQASLAWNGQSSVEQDSSFIAVDKARNADVFPLLWHLLRDTRHRIDFSRREQELVWLAFELHRQPYFFSPWAATTMSQDDGMPQDVLCGGLGQHLPTDTDALFYVYARHLVDPYGNAVLPPRLLPYEVNARAAAMQSAASAFVAPRRTRNASAASEPLAADCLVSQGSIPLPSQVVAQIHRRAAAAFAIAHIQQREMRSQPGDAPRD